ncbi:hypothetical protein PR202_gb15245 [Eleusine coracana subsp. coracana]|uniref:F-box domain-containing protein n=1 Tax=Eleusine coracana subsp. coracana TaxID=191504 RepID=A0AAV5EWN4_ELECO|nr:hypothetical protein PR202_gb15245 [Eleusine coracana subsp. coracana]
MLGKLPDDVLLSILKRLDLRDAVRSSVLSRRWRHIPSVLPDSGLVRLQARRRRRVHQVQVQAVRQGSEEQGHGASSEEPPGTEELFLSYFNTCPRAFAGLTGLHVESVKLLDSSGCLCAAATPAATRFGFSQNAQDN